jgi:GxxExxY protein
VYEAVLAKQLVKRGLFVQRQVPVQIVFEGDEFDEGFRADIIVNQCVILELKSVEQLHPVHMKQLQTYLKLTGCRLGYLLNFNEVLMKTGIHRCVNGLPEELLV